MPYLSYCIHVWRRAYETHLNRLLTLQNKAVRLIAGVHPRTHAEPLYTQLNILPVKKMYLYSISFFMYKSSNDMLPELFSNMFTPVNEIHDYETRKSVKHHLYVPFYGKTRSQKCICFTGPHMWNFILSRMNPFVSIG